MTELEMAVVIYERALRQTEGPSDRAVAEARELADRGDLDAITRKTADLQGRSIAEVVAYRERQLARTAGRLSDVEPREFPWLAVGLLTVLLALPCVGGLLFYVVARAVVRRPPVPQAATVAPAVAVAGVLPDPGNLGAYQHLVGQTLQFQVTGAAQGSLWGTDTYTSDSSLAKAAVHAGVLKAGETGVVQVRMVAPPPAFQGSTRNGVTSEAWGAWSGAFTVSRGAAAGGGARPAGVAGVLPDPGNLTAYQAQVGQTFTFQVTGSVTGLVWGTDVYTTDSSLATAAVHAGVLAVGQTGTVKVTIVAPPPAFQGSTRNGATSQDWGQYPAAFEVRRP